MSKLIRGRAHKYGDDITTDDIIPGWYGLLVDKEYGKYAFAFKEGIGELMNKTSKGINIIVAGKHFGSGSSREKAPKALREAGVKAIVAEFFARIFYRNAINQGIPVLECRAIIKKVNENDELEINIETGEIKNLTTREVIKANPVPQHLMKILNEGGLTQYYLKQKGRR